MASLFGKPGTSEYMRDLGMTLMAVGMAPPNQRGALLMQGANAAGQNYRQAGADEMRRQLFTRQQHDAAQRKAMLGQLPHLFEGKPWQNPDYGQTQQPGGPSMFQPGMQTVPQPGLLGDVPEDKRRMMAAGYVAGIPGMETVGARGMMDAMTPQGAVTPYSAIGKLQGDLASGRITQEQYDQAAAGMGGAGAPKTRTRAVGGESVTEEWRNGGWQEVSRAPRWQPSQGPQLTAAQERNNSEIDNARQYLSRQGWDAEEIGRRTEQASATGRENPDYMADLDRIVRMATRRKIGEDDSGFEPAWRQAYGGTTPPPGGYTAGGAMSMPNLTQGYAPPSIMGPSSPAAPSAMGPGQSPAADGAGPSAPQPTPVAPVGTPRWNAGQAQLSGAAPGAAPAPVPTTASGGLDKGQLRAGQVYTLPDGSRWRWDGFNFKHTS